MATTVAMVGVDELLSETWSHEVLLVAVRAAEGELVSATVCGCAATPDTCAANDRLTGSAVITGAARTFSRTGIVIAALVAPAVLIAMVAE